MTGVQVKTLDDIIEKFELQVNDLTELSTDEEIDLANDVYQQVCNDRPWRFLVKPATGALAYDSTVSMWYITKPTDFAYFCENNAYTENNMPISNDASPKVVFVGANYQPYQVINYADRIQYRTHNGVCYLDPVANKIYFPVAPADTSLYQFDYIKIPADLTDGTDEPIFPERFRKIIPFGMAVDNDILQRSSQANSQEQQNQGKYLKVLSEMQLWDANQFLN